MGFCLIVDVLDRYDALAAQVGVRAANVWLESELLTYELAARDVARRSAR